MPSDNVLGELRETIELDSNYALAHAVLARAQAMRGLYWSAGIDERYLQEAERSARLALRLAPNDPKVLALSALALLWSGSPVEALPIAEKAVKISPSYAEGFAYYGDILIHNGISAEGISNLERAIALTPNSLQLAMYLIMKAEGQIQLGDLEAARETLIESSGLSRNTVMYALSAGVELMMNNNEAAQRLLGKMLANNPDMRVQDLLRSHTFITAGEVNSNFQKLYQGLQELEHEMLAEIQ